VLLRMSRIMSDAVDPGLFNRVARLGYFCPTPRKGKIWQKLGCDARPSEDQTPEAGVFGAKTHLVNVVPAL
jgi:hypothetical protein